MSLLSKKNMNVTHYDHDQILFVRRWSVKDEVFGVFRFGTEPQKVRLPIPDGRWDKILDSWEQQWRGPGSNFPLVMETDEKTIFNFPPNGFVLYFRKTPPFNVG
jgi:maltooligosyltrehalose trehalohydrolase